MSSSPLVRQYKPSDFPTVKKIFIEGCYEHAYSSFKLALKQPHNWLLILLGFILPLVTMGSILLAILGVIFVLVVLWFCARKFFYDIVAYRLEDDLKDITKYYLQREGYNFWVVECDGQVVGMVAAIPSYEARGEKNTELQRMFVAPSHRGKGLAKILCRTVIEFARKKKCNAVVLGTTTVQISAMYMYTSVGFRFTHTTYMTKFTERVVGMQWIYYRYDIQYSK